MRFKITINIIAFLSFNFLLIISVKAQDSCDSILNKKRWENYYAKFEVTKNTFVNFDSLGNLQTFGRYNKNKKTGQWYYFTNTICDSICMFVSNNRMGKSYYFKNGEIDLVTYINKDKTIDTCYNPKISKEHYLTESFTMDGCLQSAASYNCNGVYKKCFPFNLATDKIEDLCLRIAGIKKSDYSILSSYKYYQSTKNK